MSGTNLPIVQYVVDPAAMVEAGAVVTRLRIALERPDATLTELVAQLLAERAEVVVAADEDTRALKQLIADARPWVCCVPNEWPNATVIDVKKRMDAVIPGRAMLDGQGLENKRPNVLDRVYARLDDQGRLILTGYDDVEIGDVVHVITDKLAQGWITVVGRDDAGILTVEPSSHSHPLVDLLMQHLDTRATEGGAR